MSQNYAVPDPSLADNLEGVLSEQGKVERELEARLHVVSGIFLDVGIIVLMQELGLLSLDAVIVGGQQIASSRS